jgi:cytochrome c oxidase assembly protein subunit 11
VSAVAEPALRRGLGLTAALCGVFVATMVGMSFAAVPLYSLFCQVTGYGGTIQRAEAAPGHTLSRNMAVRFDANIGNGLGWSFRPQARRIDITVGEVGQINFIATNRTDEPSTGTAVFNVTPVAAGAYFNKISCFCFTEQTIEPGETIEMPVVFFIDPAIADDINLENTTTITLSYTFYPALDADETSVADLKNELAPAAL